MTSPILLLVFNRPDKTKQVMEAIRAARPSRLYVAADGPRQARGEEQSCEEARRIASDVGWDCELKTLFRDRNLGCRLGPSTAIDWFFEHEEEGLILEDDCVPSQSFFRYCAELLERFRHDERIMCISGDNFQQGRCVTPYSYYFSRYMHCWGWASWRRAWRLYDLSMSSWAYYRQLRALDSWGDGDPTFTSFWTEIFDRSARGKLDNWDVSWLFACWAQHGLTCLPVRNLVTNIGFGSDATHTKSANMRGSNMLREELEFPLRHPPLVARHVEADRFTHVHVFGGQPTSDVRRASRLIMQASRAVRSRLKLRMRLRNVLAHFAQ